MKKRYLFLLLSIASFKGFSQTTPATPAASDYSISWYGFVRTDYIWDTRKSASVREDHLNLYPSDVVLDANGKDVNDVGQSNFLSVVSRLGVKAKGPDVWGAKVSATLEGDFFGNFEVASTSSTTIGLLRLRHAYAQLDWKKTSLTMGQTWYPTFIPEVFPGVANFSTGIMFNPFGWASQVRLKQALSNELSLTLTAYKEREFTTSGPGTQNSASINSAIPSLNAQLQYKNKSLFLGAGLEVKSLQPRTDNGSTTTKLVTTEKANSTSVFGYGKYANDKITIKAYGISGGNLFNMVMLGGYIGSTTNGIESYEATKNTAFWVDIASNGKSIAPGLFFGTSKNQGTDKAATGTMTAYGRGIGVNGARMVDNVWRLSGRVDFKKNKFRITPELELTSADWGASDTYGKATGTLTNVSNFRTMISCVYTF